MAHEAIYVAEEEGEYVVECRCGENFRGVTMSDAGGLFDMHIAQARSEKQATEGP